MRWREKKTMATPNKIYCQPLGQEKGDSLSYRKKKKKKKKKNG